MCTTNKDCGCKSNMKHWNESNNEMAEEYFQLEPSRVNTVSAPQKETPSRTVEKCVYVFATLGVITLTHCVVWAHWILPYIYVIATPIFVTLKAMIYWKYKWQYFMIDFCYFANTLTFIYLWVPDNSLLFQTVFALANGPVLIAAIMYRNSLVVHQHDKMTSCYIHLLPASLTYCLRWYPESTSTYWFKSFIEESPSINFQWSYATPFAFFFLHSVLYFLIVNVICQPQKPYITSYSYLADKYSKLNIIGGPWGQGIAFYGLNWLFCLSSLFLSLLAYYSQPAHCAAIVFIFVTILWNGGSYTAHVLNKRITNSG
ncbi:hypothetical protein ACF0H5_008637 [Mactra antiquata]